LAAEKVEYFQEYLLRKDDLIIGMDRPFTKSGFKLTKIGEADVPSLLVQRVGRFLPRSQPTAEFLPVVLQSWSYHKQLIAQQQGTEIPHLSKADILHRLIPIPPEDEQMQIGQIVSACNRLITESENQVQKAERLKRGLMQVLLTGRVRVPVVEEAQQGTRP
jgi:type I restriction enzyme S subunit